MSAAAIRASAGAAFVDSSTTRGPVGEEPHLADQLAPDLRLTHAQLEDGEGTEDHQVLQGRPVRGVGGQELALALGEDLLQGWAPVTASSTGTVGTPL